MIRKVTIINNINEELTLELSQSNLTSLLIKSIDGLGPPNANINMTEYVTNDGSLFNSAHVTSRQIIISFKILDNQGSIEDNRLKVYRYFPIKKTITFMIETDNRKCKTQALVESVEPDIFSNDEGISVTLTCPDSYFRSLSPYIINFGNVIPLFSFPFCNNDLEEKLLLMGEYKQEDKEEIFYDGEADTGIYISVKLLDTVKGIKIFGGSDQQNVIEMDDDIFYQLTGDYLQAGDEITINTIKGQRKIYLIRGGKRTNILNAFKKPINWMQISRGYNIFSYYAAEGKDNIRFSISYDILYVGV